MGSNSSDLLYSVCIYFISSLFVTLVFLVSDDCGIPENMSYADVNFTYTFVNQTSNYTCDEGFLLPDYNASQFIICQENGTWSDPEMNCTGNMVFVNFIIF